MKNIGYQAALFVLGISLNNAQANERVVFNTDKGKILIELDFEKAPETSANFLEYVDSGFYNQTIFHRVIPGFVIQGGGFNESMIQKETRPPIKNEADNLRKNLRGTLSMARTSDPHSASSQFFINLVDNDFLDHTGKNRSEWGYAVFAQVVGGLDIVDEISKVETTSSNGMQDVPVQAVLVLNAEREKS